MNPRAGKYLSLLSVDPSRKRADLCEEVGVAESTAKIWRQNYPEFKAEEDRLRELHKAHERRAKAAAQLLAQEEVSAARVAAEKGSEIAAVPLPAALERWLELYESGSGRVEALRQVRDEGLRIDDRRVTMDDIEVACGSHPEFRRRFFAVWNEQTAEIEDEARIAAKGRGQVALRILAAEKPEKYGNKVKVDHHHVVQLETHHNEQLKQTRGGWWSDKQKRLKREEAKLLAQSVPDDVIEGEVVA